MKIYKKQEEVEKDIKDGMLIINEDVKFECNISLEASIKVYGDITAGTSPLWTSTLWTLPLGTFYTTLFVRSISQ
jgi:hypothetical protein